MYRLFGFVRLVLDLNDGLANLVDLGSVRKPAELLDEEPNPLHQHVLHSPDAFGSLQQKRPNFFLHGRDDLFASFVECHGQCLRAVGFAMPK
ncbi:protein of unknown function [Hyphomicrobium sp. MC1]|nr:protein of unknown function [Hyphomicrobium sp. MC1]